MLKNRKLLAMKINCLELEMLKTKYLMKNQLMTDRRTVIIPNPCLVQLS